jgi:hypothetical protein
MDGWMDGWNDAPSLEAPSLLQNRSGLIPHFAPQTHRLRQLAQQNRGFVPANAGIRNALAINQLGSRKQPLGSGNQIALKHYAANALGSLRDLRRNITANHWLPGMVLIAVGMAAINHETG